jgi:hypothetical protein
MTRRQGYESVSIAIEERVIEYQHPNMSAARGRKRRFQLALVRNIDKQYLSSECRSGSFDFFPIRRISRFARPFIHHNAASKNVRPRKARNYAFSDNEHRARVRPMRRTTVDARMVGARHSTLRASPMEV